MELTDRRFWTLLIAIAPVPGLLAGGPNAKMNDKNFVKYDSHLPAMAYMDVEKSFASNEVAINWNAPATVIFAILDYVMGKNKKD